MSEQSDLLNAARTDLIPGIILARATFEDEATVENEFASSFLRIARMSATGGSAEDARNAEDAAQRKWLGGELNFGGEYFARWAQNPVNAPLLTFILARRHYQVTSPDDINALFKKVREAYDAARARKKGEEWQYRKATLELFGFDFQKKSDVGPPASSSPTGAKSSETAAPPPPSDSVSLSIASAA